MWFDRVRVASGVIRAYCFFVNKEMTYERNALDHRVHRNLSAAADLYFTQNGNFHLNAGCLSGDRQEKQHGTNH